MRGKNHGRDRGRYVALQYWMLRSAAWGSLPAVARAVSNLRADTALVEPVEVVTTETVTIVLDGRAHDVRYQPGETFLETARRAGLRAPFSCESGSCATCMARLEVGEAKMRVNNALMPDEVDEGWVLTCQGLPTSPSATVVYEP